MPAGAGPGVAPRVARLAWLPRQALFLLAMAAEAFTTAAVMFAYIGLLVVSDRRFLTCTTGMCVLSLVWLVACSAEAGSSLRFLTWLSTARGNAQIVTAVSTLIMGAVLAGTAGFLVYVAAGRPRRSR